MNRLRTIGRTRQLVVVLGLVTAILAVGVASGRVLGIPVLLKTGSLSGSSTTFPTGGFEGCYTSGIEGTLAAEPTTGVGIVEKRGSRAVPVTWPRGWTAHRSWLEIELVNAAGEAKFRTGDHVSLMGGYWFVDHTFLTCGGRVTPSL